MALTRSAGRAPAAVPGRRRNPSRRSRASFSRANDLSDDSTLSDDDVDSPSTIPDQSDSDSGGSPQYPPQRSSRSASDRPGQHRTLRRSTRQAAGRSQSAENPRSKASSTKNPRQATRKSNGKGPRPRSTSSAPPNKLHEAALQEDDQKRWENIPNWQDPRIPYDFWVNVFLYAGSESSADFVATNWLVHAATTCKIFTEPALTAIYRCPVVRYPSKAKRLAALLERDPTGTLFNYRSKVEFLHIDIHVVPQAILFQIIQPLSRLKELVFFTSMDQPPYRKLDANIRWHYPEDVFRALAPTPTYPDTVVEKPFPTYLKSWEWSGRLIGGYVANIDDIARIHQTPSFSHLTRLSFTNFQVPSLRNLQMLPDNDESEMKSYHEDGTVIKAVGHAIAQLKHLKHLVFESSTVMNDRLLPLLPKNLLHLELINCWEIKSEDLMAFLRTHGSNLRTLTLLHNQSLNLAFLTDLADTCPGLRELHMNLSYYRHHDSINDADPMYDFALLPDQVPKWPPSLRVLDIEHIRNWSVEAAEMFLQSLIDNGHNLPDLRHLAIKTMLDIPWQARANLRKQWGYKMERVFLCPVVSLRSDTILQQPNSDGEAPSSRKRKRGTSSPPSRRSGRLDSIRHKRGRPLYREPETDEDEFDASEASGGDGDDMSVDSKNSEPGDQTNEAEPAIQGLCKTVSVVFDNQKVREWQYSMEDFLADDDGEDSEEEWNGDDDDDDTIVIFR